MANMYEYFEELIESGHGLQRELYCGRRAQAVSMQSSQTGSFNV
jgi:hypothetical protein